MLPIRASWRPDDARRRRRIAARGFWIVAAVIVAAALDLDSGSAQTPGAKSPLRIEDFEGDWVTGGGRRAGTVTLQRAPAIDSGGARGYAGMLRYHDGTSPALHFLYAQPNGDVVFCLAPGDRSISAANAGRCGIMPCHFRAASTTELSGECEGFAAFGWPPGRGTLSRSAQ